MQALATLEALDKNTREVSQEEQEELHELLRGRADLLDALYNKGSKYIKAGIVLGNIVPSDMIQFSLFEPPESANAKKLMSVIDNINFSMSNDILKFASSGTKRNWKMRQEMRSNRFTTRWDELCEVK